MLRKHAEDQSFFGRMYSSTILIFNGLRILLKYPLLLLPIFVSWIIYAAITIYFNYYFNNDKLMPEQIILLAFGIVLSYCIIFSISALIQLEIIQQIEAKQKVNLSQAIYETFAKDFVKALPIIIIWAIIWFVLTILEAIFTRRNNKNRDERPAATYENFAKTLGGYKNFSLIDLSFDLVTSGVRMIAFFMYPAIALEDETTINAIKKGFSTISGNLVEFASGFIQTEMALSIILIPAAIIFGLSDGMQIKFPKEVWIGVTIYIGFATTLYLYLQQMFASSLYIWNMRWEKAVRKAKIYKQPMPNIEDIPKPYLLDDIEN